MITNTRHLDFNFHLAETHSNVHYMKYTMEQCKDLEYPYHSHIRSSVSLDDMGIVCMVVYKGHSIPISDHQSAWMIWELYGSLQST